MSTNASVAIFGDVVATGLVDVSTDPQDLDEGGWWAVTQTFEGEFQAFKFSQRTSLSEYNLEQHCHSGLTLSSWKSSMSEAEYQSAVQHVRTEIGRGWVYQANLCRILHAELHDDFDPVGLWKLLREHNPAPYLGALHICATEADLVQDIRVTSASPELFLARDGKTLRTSPIKGTAEHPKELQEKDHAENVMIVDLMRNDLSEICEAGSIQVPELLRIEQHPGLIHLVSDVQGQLRNEIGWAQILRATMPPGSVSGAPKSSALEVINRLEPVKRNIYCGTLGWVDADNNKAQLAVAIRTFWQSLNNGHKQLNFGTGAGITWGSDPKREWQETELKAKHLLTIASMTA